MALESGEVVVLLRTSRKFEYTGLVLVVGAVMASSNDDAVKLSCVGGCEDGIVTEPSSTEVVDGKYDKELSEILGIEAEVTICVTSSDEDASVT